MQISQEKIEDMLRMRIGITVGSIARDLDVGYTTAGNLIDELREAGRISEDYDDSVGGFRVLGREGTPKVMFIIATAEEIQRIPKPVLDSADVVLVVVHADLLRVEKNCHGSVGSLISWQGIPGFFANIRAEKFVQLAEE